MRRLIGLLISDRSGSNALEYGLIVALVSLAIVAGATAAGGALNTLFSTIGSELTSLTGTI